MTDYFICFHFGDRKYIKRLENRVLVLIFATKNLKKNAILLTARLYVHIILEY